MAGGSEAGLREAAYKPGVIAGPIAPHAVPHRSLIRPVDEAQVIAVPDLRLLAVGGGSHRYESVILTLALGDDCVGEEPFHSQPGPATPPRDGEVAHTWGIRHLGVKGPATLRGQIEKRLVWHVEESEYRFQRAGEAAIPPVGKRRTAKGLSHRRPGQVTYAHAHTRAL